MFLPTRRDALRSLVAGGLALAAPTLFPSRSAAQAAPKGPFTLPRLPYAFNALEPHIDARTMEIHHDRHHQTYVNNLNTALADQAALARQSIEQILRDITNVPQTIRQAVINNGGGHANHTLFWEIMGPGAGGEPTGTLLQAINASFESFANFKQRLTTAAMTRFGSGWAWLVLNNGRLEIQSSPNQDSPLMEGKTPILGLDVWEHAYYLHYQNRRADYVAAWWNLVNWPAVAQKYAAARG